MGNAWRDTAAGTGQLVEITPSLMTAIDRLNDQISAVEALLSADDAVALLAPTS